MACMHNCYAGNYSSVLAVAYHSKILDENREATKEEIWNLQ